MFFHLHIEVVSSGMVEETRVSIENHRFLTQMKLQIFSQYGIGTYVVISRRCSPLARVLDRSVTEVKFNPACLRPEVTEETGN